MSRYAYTYAADHVVRHHGEALNFFQKTLDIIFNSAIIRNVVREKGDSRCAFRFKRSL